MEDTDNISDSSTPIHSIIATSAFKQHYQIGKHDYGINKVRKNAAHLSEEERKDFLDAIIGLKRTMVNEVYSLYDQFVILHMGAVSLADPLQWDDSEMKVFKQNMCKVDPAHGNPSFLAWHRMLLHEFEKALQRVNPNVTLPYWDWTDVEESKNKIFIDEFMGRNGGIEGIGGPLYNSIFLKENGFVIKEDLHRPGKGQPSIGEYIVRNLGPFEFLATKQSEFTEFQLSNTFGPREVAIDQFGSAKPAEEDKRGFRFGIEAGKKAHNPTHNWYGYGNGPQVTAEFANSGFSQFPTQGIYENYSTMPNVACSNNDPIFWLHHCNVDRLWAEWQQAGHYGDMYFPKEGRDQFPIVSDASKTSDSNSSANKSADSDSTDGSAASTATDGTSTAPAVTTTSALETDNAATDSNNDSQKLYTFPYGHNLDQNMWPWDIGQSSTVPWLQDGLSGLDYNGKTVTPKNVLSTADLGYVYDSYIRLSENQVKPLKAHLPANYKGKQVFKFNISSPNEKAYFFELIQYGASLVDDIKIHKVYNKNNISEWKFQDEGFDSDSEVQVNQIDDGKVPNYIKRYSFLGTIGTYYLVVSGKGDSDINSYYTVRLCGEAFITPQQEPDENVHKFKDGKITVDLVSKLKGSKDYNFFYAGDVGKVTLNLTGFDSLIQLVGPSSTNHSINIIGLDESCCKLEAPSVSSMITPGFYLVLVHHCSFGNAINKKGTLNIEFEVYEGENKVNNVENGETKSCCLKNSNLNALSAIPLIKEDQTLRNQSIPANGDILYRLVLNGEHHSAKHLIKISLDSSISTVFTNIYKVVRKEVPDMYGNNQDSILIGSGKKKTVAKFPLEDGIEYYIRLSFPQAPHHNQNDSFTIKFKSF